VLRVSGVVILQVDLDMRRVSPPPSTIGGHTHWLTVRLALLVSSSNEAIPHTLSRKLILEVLCDGGEDKRRTSPKQQTTQKTTH